MRLAISVLICLSVLLVPGRPTPGAAEPPKTNAPPAIAQPSCQIQLATRLAHKRGRYEIEAVATNKTDTSLKVRLSDRCPAGPVEFTGLTTGWDFHRTCAKGACAERRPFIEIELPPRKTVVLDFVEVDPAYGNCNPALRPGSYALAFRPPASAATVCGPEPVWIHHRVSPPAAPQSKPRSPRR